MRPHELGRADSNERGRTPSWRVSVQMFAHAMDWRDRKGAPLPWTHGEKHTHRTQSIRPVHCRDLGGLCVPRLYATGSIVCTTIVRRVPKSRWPPVYIVYG